MKLVTLAALAALIVLAPSGAGAQEGNPVTPAPVVDLAWNRLYDYAELTAALRALEAAHPGWLRVESIGKSVEGRDIWLAVLSDPDGLPDVERPAMYIDANVHGNEIQGGEVCLYTIWYLLENRERLDKVRSLLDRVAFYFVPTVNPDGRHRWFHGPTSPHSPRSGLKPLDEDRDGLLDEDGPDDLDGDGSATHMRKRVDSGGTHRIDPDDPRRMVEVPPDGEGDYILLGREGIDNDGDGRINEDGPGGYDMNRNFPGDWAPEWIQGGAGDYPLCFPETRAVADFLLAHPNVAAVQSYHNAGGMILRGPGNPDLPPYPNADLAVYGRLGQAGESVLPHYRYMVLRDDLYPVRGGFVTFAYEGLGIFSFTNELWSDLQYDGASRDEEVTHGDRRRSRLRFDDEVEMGRHFKPWTPYTHPTYGEIEIGGFGKASSRVPPLFMLEELCHRNMAFTLKHASEMPELAVTNLVAEDLGGGILRVRAEVANARLIPTISAMAAKTRCGLPDFLELSVSGGVVVAGGLLEGEPLLETMRPQQHRPARLRVESGVASHGRIRAEWIVDVNDPEGLTIEVVYRAEKGGTVSRTLGE